LHLGESIFGYWRQSTDRRQNIFCIYNISDTEQDIHLSELNITEFDSWVDLLSGTVITDIDGVVNMRPYDALWISNQNS